MKSMSTTRILLALLLSLISGSTEGRERMDSVGLLRQTLKYWWKIYRTYEEEVALGYCWAKYYFLKIRDELSNLSIPLSATKDRSNTTTGATKSLQNPFPENVMATWFRDIRGTRLRREPTHTMVASAISKLIDDFNEHWTISESKIIKNEKWMSNGIGQDIIPYNKKVNYNINATERIAQAINHHAKRRRQIPAIMQTFFCEETKFPRNYEFSSHGTTQQAVNMASNLKNDDKVISKSRDLEEDTRRKVLCRLASNLSSLAEDSFRPSTFSLELSRRKQRKSLCGHRFPFRLSRGRESNWRISQPLFYPGLKKRKIKQDPEGHSVSLKNGGSYSMLSRLQFRRVNVRRDRIDVIKLMDSKGNSSYIPEGAINSKMPRWKPEELSHNSLLSPRGRIAERSLFKSRENGEAVNRNLPRRVTKKSDVEKQDYWKQRKKNKSRKGKGTLTAETVHPEKTSVSFLLRLNQLYQQLLYENLGLFSHPTVISEGSRQDNDSIQSTKSLHHVRRYIRNTKDSMKNSTQNSRANALINSKNQNQPFIQSGSLLSGIYLAVITGFRTLGMFVQVGRQIMGIIESNAMLACTNEYLWSKLIRWIDS